MTRVAPCIVNSVSCVKRIDHESHFSWQAQYLVKLKQYLVKFGFFNRKCSWRARKVTSLARRVAE